VVANRSADFNYKVALASGLKSLQGGRLRQAEEQFRYLVQHFPSAEGGYRGLAKVLVEQEDRKAALKVLNEGGAALAKAGQREQAIAIYKEATTLDAQDLSAHRRLAAALQLAGREEEAAHEYLRFVRVMVERNEPDRAKNEAGYALEKMPGNAELLEAAKGIGAAIPRPPAPRRETPAERESLMANAFGTAPVAPLSTSTASWTAPAPTDGGPSQWGAPAAAADAWQTTQTPAQDAAWGAVPSAQPEMEPIAADTDALVVEATAARYLAKGDPRGGQAALEAAKRYIADGRVDAASDLLLQLIGAGISDHDAQRLLVDVTRSLGKRDVAKAKAELLVQALKLDGRSELAAEVEQLAEGF
jgi:thioredoxin-like negative regulator of GroEL